MGFFFCISSSSSVTVPGRTCHQSIQTTNSSGTLLDRSSLASHSSPNMLDAIPPHLSPEMWYLLLVDWVIEGL